MKKGKSSAAQRLSMYLCRKDVRRRNRENDRDTLFITFSHFHIYTFSLILDDLINYKIQYKSRNTKFTNVKSGAEIGKYEANCFLRIFRATPKIFLCPRESSPQIGWIVKRQERDLSFLR